MRAGTPWAVVAFGWEAEAIADVMAEYERQGWSRAQLLDELVRVCHSIGDELYMESFDEYGFGFAEDLADMVNDAQAG